MGRYVQRPSAVVIKAKGDNHERLFSQVKIGTETAQMTAESIG
jgi:hypothetical protein